MLDRLVTKIQSVVARVIAWQINENHERAALRALEAAHAGANALLFLNEWVDAIQEVPGRHALRLAAHH